MRFAFVFIFSLLLAFSTHAQSDTITLASGLRYIVLKEGKGGTVSKGDKVLVHYTGRLANGFVFDTSEDEKPLKFNAGIGKVIKGWDEMLLLMRVGEEVEVIIPAELAYGERGVPNRDGESFLIPPGATLYFKMRLMKVDRY